MKNKEITPIVGEFYYSENYNNIDNYNYILKYKDLNNNPHISHYNSISNDAYSSIGRFRDYKDENNLPRITFEQFKKYVLKEEEFVLPEIWHCIITKENQEVLSKWRLSNCSSLLNIGYLVGMTKHGNNRIFKGHNPGDKISEKSIFSYDFGNEITYEQFLKYVLKQDISFGEFIETENTIKDKIFTLKNIEDLLDKTYEKEDVEDIMNVLRK